LFLRFILVAYTTVNKYYCFQFSYYTQAGSRIGSRAAKL